VHASGLCSGDSDRVAGNLINLGRPVTQKEGSAAQACSAKALQAGVSFTDKPGSM
jgi:hypothetical protein